MNQIYDELSTRVMYVLYIMNVKFSNYLLLYYENMNALFTFFTLHSTVHNILLNLIITFTRISCIQARGRFINERPVGTCETFVLEFLFFKIGEGFCFLFILDSFLCMIWDCVDNLICV